MAAFRIVAALILFAQALLIAFAGTRLLSRIPVEKLRGIGNTEIWVSFALVGLLFTGGAWQVLKGKGRWFAWMASLPTAFVYPGWLRIVGALPLVFLLVELVTPWIRNRRGGKAAEADQTEQGATESKRQIFETLIGLGVLTLCGWAWSAAPKWIRPAIPEEADGGWLALIAAIWVSIFVHELGHALGGAVSQFRLTRFAVFPFDFARTSKRTYFKLNFGMLGGYYMGLPRHIENLERRHLILTMAGPAAGFAFAAVCWLVLWRANGSITGFGFDALYTAMGFSLATNILNLLPLRFGGLNLDGRVIWNSMFQRPEAHAAIAVLGCYSSMHSSLRPRDWPEEWVDVLRDSLDSGTAPLLSVSAEDRLVASPGDPQALSDLALCSAVLDKIAAKIPDKNASSAFRFHRAWIRCRYGGETSGAEDLLVEAGKDPETDPHEILRLQAALLDAAGDTAGARDLVNQAEQTLVRRPARHGIDAADLDGLRAYREELDARAA